ncbi:MAG: S-layer protein [Clostridia bacterium]|nr:S-layer protein [Clostridia bacterium]
MQIRKRISLLLVVAILMTLFPVTVPVMAAETTNIQLVKDTANYGNVATGQVFYFGQYTKNDNSKAPILWRVMGVESGEVTLMSEYILEYRKYDDSSHQNWAGSDICRYLNSQDIYTSDGFLTTAFTTAEQGDIVPYGINDESYGWGTIDSMQRIVLPSINEVRAGGAFGWNQDSDRVAQEAEGYRYRETPFNKDWWLRSPSYMTDLADCVVSWGQVFGGWVTSHMGVRPAFKLDMSNVLFASDAYGGGVKKGTPSSTLNSVQDTSNDKKLTLIDKYDESSNPTGQKTISAVAKGKYIPGDPTEIEINYSGATTGANQYLSAMMINDSGIKYYGVIKALPADEDTSGTAKLTIPADFDDTMAIKIFTEQLNGDKMTDYASEPVPVTITAATNEAALTLHKGDKVYFGRKGDAPILWRVMEKDMAAETLTLMSECILEYRQYDPSEHNNWSGSDICNYLNSTGSYENDDTEKGFLKTAFTEDEQGWITTYSTIVESGYNSEDTFRPEQQIVLPSANEVKDSGTWAFSGNPSRIAQNVEIVQQTYNQRWWLRSPGNGNGNGAYVSPLGHLFDHGRYVFNELGVRPVLKLNLSSVSFASVEHIEAANGLTNILNGMSKDDLKLRLPLVVAAETTKGDEGFDIKWQLDSVNYNPDIKTVQTFLVPGKVTFDTEGIVKLVDGVSLDATIEVTVDEASYHITYHLNEGSQVSSAPTKFSYGTETTLPMPTRQGYTFAGWYDNQNLTGAAITAIGTHEVGDKEYWAKWTQAPTITTTSLGNGTVGTSYSQVLEAIGDIPITWSVKAGALPVGLTLDPATGEIRGVPTVSGTFNFAVQAANGEGSDTQSLSIVISAAPVVPQTYTVTFNSNGGSAVSPIINISRGTTLTFPIPTRANYRFEGWFSGDEKYTNSTPITENVTLIAKWAAIGTPSDGGGNTTTSNTSTIENRIASLRETQKEQIAAYFEERLPYTTLNPSLTIEMLKQLTGNKFTEAELEAILASPALLEKLGITEDIAIHLITPQPIEDAAFTDVPRSHWAYETIREAARLGIAAGMPDDSFAPRAPLQAADTFTFLDRILLLNHVEGMRLTRSTVEKYISNKGHWAFYSMASIGSRLSEETLKTISQLGSEPLSRELLAEVLYEITEGKLEPIREEIAFADTETSPYKEAIAYCTKLGLISGRGSTRMAPNKAVTRAELMSILIRLDNVLK